MIFPYWEVQRGDQTRRLPLVPLRVRGTSEVLDVLALVDSGAEHNVFGLDVAKRLQIPVEDGDPVTIVGIGGVPVSGRLVRVKLQLGRHQWTAPAIFSAAANEHAILGQVGFFAFFTATFRYQEHEMNIRRSG